MLSSTVHKGRKQENFRDQSANLEMLRKSKTEGRPPRNDSKKDAPLHPLFLPSVSPSDASSIWKVRVLRAGVPSSIQIAQTSRDPLFSAILHLSHWTYDWSSSWFVPLHKGQRFIPSILCPLYQNHSLLRMEICHLSKETDKLTVLRLPYRGRWLIK